MARDVESLVLQMSADLSRFEKSMAGMRQTADRRLTEVERRAQRSETALARTMGKAGDGMVAAFRTSLGALAPTLAAAFSTQQVVRYADAYTGLQNRLKAVGLEGEALKRTEDALFEAANRNGVAVSATAELYQRAAMARENLGATEEQLLQIVSGTAAALKLQGTSATEASGALLQLGQLLGGNMVQAQEYNSLIDQLPTVLEAVAKGSDRWGGSVNKLTLDVKAGKVSVQEWSAAMLKGFADIQQRADAATQTVSGALQRLNNELGRFIGQTDSGLSATARMAQAINLFADNLDKIIPTLGTLALLVGGRYAVAMTAAGISTAVATVENVRYQAALIGLQARQTGATSAQVALNAAMRANPIGIVITLIASLAAGLYLLNKRFNEGEIVNRRLADQSKRTSDAFKAYEKAARDAAAATGEAKKAADALVAAKRAAYIVEINQAQAIAQTTLQMAAQRAEMARLAALEAKKTGPRTEGEAIGQLAYAGGTQSEAVRAQAQADRAAADERKAREDYANLQRDIRNGFRTPAAPGAAPAASTRAGRDSGPSADQLAARRAELALEMEIIQARATGNAADIAAAEERQRLAQLRGQYESAGYADANARALEHLGLLNQAEVRAENLAGWIKKSDEFWEQMAKDAEAAADAAQLLTDQTLDRLGYEAQIARLSGDEGAIRNAERRLFIENRTLEILRLKLATTEAEARAMAGGEWGKMAETEDGRTMARNIVDTLRSDNVWEEAGRRFKDAAWDGVEQLISSLFSGSPGQGVGGWIAGLFSGMGKRATGGPVVGGQPYIVGERRPEVFVPNVSGTVIPSVNAAMAKASQPQASARPAVMQFDLRGAVVTEDLLAQMNRIGAVAAGAGRAMALAEVGQEMKRQNSRRQFVR